MNVWGLPIILTTRRKSSGHKFKGGVSSYRKIKRDLRPLLRISAAYVTTMIDYYRLPRDFPGMADLPTGNVFSKAQHLEAAFAEDVGNRQFLPHLQLHEFESLLFCNLEAIDEIMAEITKSRKLSDLEAIASQFESPEEIDEENEPPAKRLESLYPRYRKVLHGVRIARRISSDTGIRAFYSCGHFSDWVRKLEKLGQNEGR